SSLSRLYDSAPAGRLAWDVPRSPRATVPWPPPGAPPAPVTGAQRMSTPSPPPFAAPAAARRARGPGRPVAPGARAGRAGAGAGTRPRQALHLVRGERRATGEATGRDGDGTPTPAVADEARRAVGRAVLVPPLDQRGQHGEEVARLVRGRVLVTGGVRL